MTLFSYKVYQWELCGTPHCSQVAWVNTTVQIPNTPALFIRSQKNSMFPLSSISCVSYVTPTHQNRALTVLEGLSSMFILGQADIKQLLNGTAVRASCTLVFLIWGPAKSNHYQSMSRLESNQSVSPSGGKTQREFSNVSDEAHPLRDLCCALESAPVWEDHQQNCLSGNITKPQALLCNLSQYHSLSSKTRCMQRLQSISHK